MTTLSMHAFVFPSASRGQPVAGSTFGSHRTRASFGEAQAAIVRQSEDTARMSCPTYLVDRQQTTSAASPQSDLRTHASGAVLAEQAPTDAAQVDAAGFAWSKQHTCSAALQVAAPQGTPTALPDDVGPPPSSAAKEPHPTIATNPKPHAIARAIGLRVTVREGPAIHVVAEEPSRPGSAATALGKPKSPDG